MHELEGTVVCKQKNGGNAMYVEQHKRAIQSKVK